MEAVDQAVGEKAFAEFMTSHGFEWWSIEEVWQNPKEGFFITEQQALFFYTICQKAERETAETILDAASHTTECQCCATGGGQHDWGAHRQVIIRYVAQLSPPQDTTKQEEES